MFYPPYLMPNAREGENRMGMYPTHGYPGMHGGKTVGMPMQGQKMPMNSYQMQMDSRHFYPPYHYPGPKPSPNKDSQ